MNSIDDYQGLWRAASNNAVKYSDDFPECFLLLPELVDGSIAQGNCTKILIQINKIIRLKFQILILDVKFEIMKFFKMIKNLFLIINF